MALKQTLSQSRPGNERIVASALRSPVSLSKNLNRLLSAAVVSPWFQSLLLSDPAAALAAGYNGEEFLLTPAEYAAVTSLRASTLRDFATQLLHALTPVTDNDALDALKAQPGFDVAEAIRQ